MTQNKPLKDYCYYAAGGPADRLALPQSLAEAEDILNRARADGLPVTVLGLGSNVLVADAGIEGLVLLTTGLDGLRLEDGKVYAEAGVHLADLVSFASENGLGDITGLIGIPGTLGGAVFMNAGAYEAEISSHLVSLVLYDLETGERVTRDVTPEDFGYRSSFIQGSDYIVLEAVFDFDRHPVAELFANLRTVQKKRRLSQPLDMASCGSAFKRPPGYYVGKILTDLELKGVRHGEVGVSAKHAGFIVNYGQATAAEIRAFYRFVQDEVKRRMDVELNPEVQFIGRWEDA